MLDGDCVSTYEVSSTVTLDAYQETSHPSSAQLSFVVCLVLLTPLLYGYLLAFELTESEAILVRALPTLSLLFLALAALSLLLRLRRQPLWVQLLPWALGPAVAPWLPRRLPLVSPHHGFAIHRLYVERGELAHLLPVMSTAFCVAAFLAVIPAILLRRPRRSSVATVAHGSARWATLSEAVEGGLGPHPGVHLGYFADRPRHPLNDDSDHHILVLAPPGTGKTTAIVIPTLLSYQAPAWVLDPKGELWETTSGWRSREFGHRCIRFAPTDPATLAWNPLLEIPTDPSDIATAMVLARNLVVSPAAGGELHWTLAARSLWTLLALHVRYAPDLPTTMASLRALLSAHENHDDLFDELAAFSHDPGGLHQWLHPTALEPTATHPEVHLLARKFRATPARERGSIVSTLQQYLDPWGDPQIARATSRSDFDLGDLLEPPAATYYLSIPFHDLGRLAPLVRLQLTALARRLTLRPTDSPHRLEILVDEYASLGRLPIMEDLLAFLRGYNARATLLLQDLAQLQRLYGLQESISGNCRVHLTTATQSTTTRRHASSLAGVTTARYRRTSRSQSAPWAGRSRRSISTVESSRPLITEGEVGALALDHGLLYKAGIAPIRIRLRPFFRDPDLLARVTAPASAAPPTDSDLALPFS